ncbi:MAG: hypothetical protein V7695_02625 [Sulfitobacter sp.]
MKQIVFLKHLSLFETTTDEMEDRLDECRLRALYDDLGVVFEKHGIDLKSYEVSSLPMQKMSIQYCNVCNQLMVNRDLNPTKFGTDVIYAEHNELCLDGGTHEGKNLCEECLPVLHRWGHFS